MPVDPAMVDAMLGTFRDLLNGVRTSGSTGEDVDEMAAALAEMEALGQELSDVGDFSAKLAGGGHYQRFTDAYTRVMTAAAGAGTTGAPATIPDDETLLAQSLQAYEASLQQLRTMSGQEEAIGVLEQLLVIGRSGVTYPVFLRQVDEAGLNEALGGTITPAREALAAVVEQSRSTGDVAREAAAIALLERRDAMAAASPTGSIDPFTFELERFRIAAQHAPAIALRDAVVQRIPRLLDLVVDWLDAHTTWAARDDRFTGPSAAETQRRIEMARECNPGFYAVRVAQFAEAFGPGPWWQRPELEQERAAGRILWTDTRMQLAMDALPACVPMATAPTELVARAEAFGPNVF
ncbi:hypothetical protein [Aeromicrobium ginsengisoli]|uniref:DUF885 domain-containing protein n=1 Tax=Aeromicrobium ginsengisoli TaxID=363867 RepID=A0A5M4FFB6_9ACTN|nr:hypothetical protein [Aeromicrobium ginsengisoli]KAA1397523.1 hypothetical protein ESP70_009110 [Aeromicrobium ginsengisoli]